MGKGLISIRRSFREKNVRAYFAGVVVVTILLMLNAVTANRLTFDLSPGESQQGYTTYSPRLSLPKGNYSFDISGEGEYVVSNADGAVFGSGSGKIDVTLDRDQSLIVIKGNSDSGIRVVIEKDGAIFNDTLFVSMLIAVFLFYIGYIHFIKQKDLRKSLIYVVLIGAAVFSAYPLFSDYISYGQDLNFHLYRIEGLKDGLLSGQFPVRLDPTHNEGYGYITASVYPSLFLYLPALLRLCGVSLVTAYKLFLVAVNLATAFIMYRCTRKIADSDFAGLFAALVYTLSTWRIENMLYRAAIGETLAMTFFPVVILGFYHIIRGEKSKWWVLMLGCSAVFHSHVISCIFVAMLGIVLVVVFAKNIVKEKRYGALIKAAVFTVLINLWYLIPFITYYFGVDLAIRHTPDNTEYFSNAIFPAEMFNFFNDQFGYSQLMPLGIRGDMSLSLGVGVTLCLGAAVLYFIFGRRKVLKDHDFHTAIFLFALFILFMTSTLFPSELLQKSRLFNVFAGTVRMPWRFLSLASPIICMVSAAVAENCVRGERNRKITIGIAGLICVIAFAVFGTAYTTSYDASFRKGQAAPQAYSAGWDDEYFIFGTDKSLLVPEKYTVSGDTIELLSYDKQGTNITLTLSGAADGDFIEVPLLYYPGYSARNGDGERLEIVTGDNNVLRVQLTGGTDSVTIKYAGLLRFKIGCVISLAAVLYLGLSGAAAGKTVNRWRRGKNDRFKEVPQGEKA